MHRACEIILRYYYTVKLKVKNSAASHAAWHTGILFPVKFLIFVVSISAKRH